MTNGRSIDHADKFEWNLGSGDGRTDEQTYAVKHLVLVTAAENLAAARASPETRPEPSGRELGLIYFQRGAKKKLQKKLGFLKSL